ncbi:hypothetical protein V1477_006656 [Vespula maculifrons]|uniref:Uncharacterized protein n=1 Tax=Vespula maculifrons TaxID=7453 RepID=A0ABD2CJG3_VESMC
MEKKNFSLAIVFSETIVSRASGPGSLERSCSALYAYISFVLIRRTVAEEQRKQKFPFKNSFSETIAPRATGPGSLERERRVLYAHIFFFLIVPTVTELYRFERNKAKKNFSLTIFFSETIAPRATRPGYLERAHRALYVHHLEQPDQGSWKGLVAPSMPTFLRPDRTDRSRIITV